MEKRKGPRTVNKPLILYGKGALGKLAVEIFAELNIPVRSVIDKDDLPIYLANQQDYLVAVCVATSPFTHILGQLAFIGFEDIVPVWDIIEAYPEIGLRNGWFVELFNKEDSMCVRQIRDGLADENSRKTYSNFFAWRSARTLSLPEYEVREFGDYRPLSSTLGEIRRRRNAYRRNAIGQLENNYIHAEGLELLVVETSLDRFIKQRPDITVACYHSRDGLWKIQKTLMDNLSNYNFYFNMYAYQGQAAYFTCKPK